ncbi:MAG: hypothetical protein ACLSBB_14595 [Ruthenibacterium lactatiformans]
MKDEKVVEHVLAAVMLCGVLAGCGGTGSYASRQSASAAGIQRDAEGYRERPITLRGMVALNAVKDWNTPGPQAHGGADRHPHRMECVPDAGFTEAQLAFASDDLPDIILRAKISPGRDEICGQRTARCAGYLDYANLSALIEQDGHPRITCGRISIPAQLNKTEGT